jgi:hypothetical protein
MKFLKHGIQFWSQVYARNWFTILLILGFFYTN